ncbi:hypothetical protein OTK51_20910 [Vibrio scophthalmi]|uniref:hypothetical protein n=1 Tax=Vibrio scophthalmi TaxID=45658 RepID=UPI002284874E|nr:hypothetical protein [Vibrio scophthalmi]MCY9805888.1 hypothetical protein [Vibrio scophthalmi]
MWQELVFQLGGYGVILVGLSAWLGKVWATRIQQSEASKLKEDLELKLNHLKASLESKTHISKLQYEHEFEHYIKLWGLVNSIPNDIERLKGNYDEPVSFLNSVLDILEDRHRTIIDYANSQYPFIEVQVFNSCIICCDSIERLRHNLNELHSQAKSSTIEKMEIYTELNAFCRAYIQLGQKLALSIKTRNSSLLVVRD